ncbi:MAG: sigma-54 dependent transcriptional regulator [Ignavibacteria bacterium]
MEYKLLGESIQIKELNETIKQVAPTDISVLISGESGTGKEVVANAIYFFSKRKDKPYIKVNCGAIPEGIIESELFGHQKGAFTGAIETRPGYFEMADKGTIFLDEIGEMPLATQVKILRVLESGEFMKVGGNKNVKVDVRVIAATNRDLQKEVLNKNFREDLYFRLKSINLHIPPLRERKTDVKTLFNNFIEDFCKKNNLTFKGIDEEAMEYVVNYDWSGNARELKNFCESIIVLYPDKKLNIYDVKKHLKTESGDNRSLPALQLKAREQIEKDLILRALFELKSDIFEVKNILQESYTKEPQFKFLGDDFILAKEDISSMSYDEIEKEILLYLLNNNNWDVSKVAKSLGQTPRNIYIKIKKFNLSKKVS